MNRRVQISVGLVLGAIAAAGCGEDPTDAEGNVTSPPPGCPIGQTDCGAGCVDLNTNGSHCGSCGTTCGTGTVCVMGACACQAWLTDCLGTCVDTNSDPANCGTCGTNCGGDVCAAGTCAADCPAQLLQCGQACVDVSINPFHCGACDSPCVAEQTCTAGSCQCTAGLTLCGSSCVNPQVDGANCGQCGVVCTATQSCSAGVCVEVGGGSGGAPPGSGGATPGSGGAAPGSGGAPPGSGGAPPGSGGAPPGSGGVAPGSGGVAPGSGGATGTGGDATVGDALTGDIIFSPPSGTFQGELQVSVSTNLNGVDLRYTTDGSLPTSSSPVYDGAPIVLSTTTQLRVQAYLNTIPAGALGTAMYVARNFDTTLDLPIVLLNNYGGGPLDNQNRVFVDAAFMTFGTDGGTASLSAAPDLVSRAGIHVRGQSTAMFAKIPYRVELRANDDTDADYPVLGMPEESDWAMRGPYADKALIRDGFFYDLGRDMGMVSPRWAYCEFYITTDGGPVDEDDYQGVYLVVETIKNSRNRLDLRQLREDDTAADRITGGYIFKFEWMAAEDQVLEGTCEANLPCWSELEVVDPSPMNATQETWLTNHIQSFHDVLNGASFTDPTTGYASLIDVDSFVDQLIVNELGREMDSYIRSAVFYKDHDTLITAGPLWDYNLTLGVGGFFDNDLPEGWQYEQERTNMNNNWFPRLIEDPAFVARLATRWQELRQGILSDAEIDARITALTAPLVNAAGRNFQKWNNLDAEQVEMFNTPATATWEEQVQFLRDWLAQRVAWLDTQWQ
jgi:hypothetical protein